MTVRITCRRCKELIAAEDADALMAQVLAHARDHGGAHGVHNPSRERILGHLRRRGDKSGP